jgi:putative DNA primase/helicase
MAGSDFAGISCAALSSACLLLPRLIPGGRFSRHEYVVRNPRRDNQRPGSFKVHYRSGVWKDFATGNRGGDLRSLVAYISSCNQCEAARRPADRLGVSVTRPNGAVASKPNGSHNGATHPAPHIYSLGDDRPPLFQDEIRRRVYRSDGVPVQIKVKNKKKKKKKIRPDDPRWISWYRIFRGGAPLGWQAQKTEDFHAVPYVSTSLYPFDTELKNNRIFWPEGEKGVDTLSRSILPAFAFGGTGHGLPHGIKHYLKDRHLVILADNDGPGRQHADKKAKIAHEAGAPSIRVVHFSELPPNGDISDFITNGPSAENNRVVP